MPEHNDQAEVSPGKGYKWLVLLVLVLLGVVAVIAVGDNGNDADLPATGETVEDDAGQGGNATGTVD